MSLVGRTLSHYDVLEEISRGGMGVVYRARDTRLHRDVALKVLPADLVSDPARRERFVQEARAASALEHPHIAVIHGIDEADGISFIAMELVRGEKLSDVIARGALPPQRALELAIEIAEGLSRAHEKGIVHRDLKPANVMLTEDGHAKIIDFGLAKLVDGLAGTGGETQTALKNQTDPGIVLGTVTYMSPEQARGARVDHRTDVFSFGILVYEMLTGRPPFRGSTSIDTMHAILHEAMPPLPPLGGTVDVDLDRILQKCLAKDPNDRYQGLRDAVVDLRAARRRLDSAPTTTASATVGATSWNARLANARGWALGAAALVILVLGGYSMYRERIRHAAPAAAVAGEKPSVAVLYFENNTGNAQLDWLRTGLADMLVTDLSQSPDVEVLPTDRLVQILGELRRQDDRTISFETVQEVAKRAGVKTVILGSYVKAGDTIRINIKLQEPSTGRIVTAERVEAIGESNLFPTVDDLTRRIKAKFTPVGLPTDGAHTILPGPAAATAPAGSNLLDRDLKDVTTSSIEAYRYYAEGVAENDRGHYDEAIPLFEKALQADPDFALAMAKLSVNYGNIGKGAKRIEYARRALEHADRVTIRERYYIQGFYAQATGDMPKAIDAYTSELKLYPDHQPSRNNLGTVYLSLDRYQDASQQFEELRRRGTTFVGTYLNLAIAYDALGRLEDARRSVEDYLRLDPRSSRAWFALGYILADTGKVDEAIAAFDKSDAIQPNEVLSKFGRARIMLMTGQWTKAEALAASMTRLGTPQGRAFGAMTSATAQALRGRTAGAIHMLNDGARGAADIGAGQESGFRSAASDLHLQLRQPQLALEEAERPLTGSDQLVAVERLTDKARALVRLNRPQELAETRTRLEQALAAIPSDSLKWRLRLVDGEAALQRGDAAAAIASLQQGIALMSPRPNVTTDGSEHLRLWFDLGTAYLDAHDEAKAAEWFQRLADSGAIRLGAPVQYVRSLYYLGEIADRRGDRAKAADYYKQFVALWGDGDVDRDRVASARGKLAAWR